MPLPNCENAYVPLAKLTEYLLKERVKGEKGLDSAGNSPKS